jgi:hypothetical protein
VVSRTSPSHCGVCGISCPSGRCDTYNGHQYCHCTSNSQCSPRICRTLSPGANECACEIGAGECPGGTSCVNVSGGPNYCTY